jgi:tetratricopeptide (TPR) repeat protein
VAALSERGDPNQQDVEELLPLALSRPKDALAKARAILAERPGPHSASVAHQVAGIVAREFGDVPTSLRELRSALRLARQAGSAERQTEVLASLGVALIYAGRTAAGLAAFDRAMQGSSGIQAARVLHRRGLALWGIGHYPSALADLRRAVPVLRRAGDALWAARALNARGLVYDSMGFPRRADVDFVAAESLFAQTSQQLEASYIAQNRALAAFGLGDIPAALSLFDEAAARYRTYGVSLPSLSIDRCGVLLAAGLAGDAFAEAHAAVRAFDQAHGQIPRRAELSLMAANCALAAGHPQQALDWAQTAHRLFRSQRSAWWSVRAVLVLAQARHASGVVSAALLRDAGRAAATMEALGTTEAAQAHLLAGRVARALGRRRDADRHFAAAARNRRRGPAMNRVAGWLSAALCAEAAGNSRALYTACQHGLAVIEENRFSLGASELRAQVTAHGAELAALAQRHAARTRRPRLLLAWTERWRATALAVPPVRPTADPQLNVSLAALRKVSRALEQAQGQGTPTLALQRERQRLESVARAHALRARGGGGPRPATVGTAELLHILGPAQLIQIADVDGDMRVLVCGGGRVRQFSAGHSQDAIRAAGFAGFALRRLARGRAADNQVSALDILKATGPRLQQALLGPAEKYLGGGPVVIVPPSRFHTVPWGLLPALHDRAVTVAPSATAWVRAHTAAPPRRRHVTLARGPGLLSDGAEVTAVAPLYDDVTVLSGDAAAAADVLAALDGAWLAHIAAHGRFRADSPLFSSLRMQDGPLTVYDFEQLHRAPHWLILSSCDSGLVAPVGADELLGLASSLLQLGTAGIVAGVAPLNDHAVVPVMLELHRRLLAGLTPAEALRDVRCEFLGGPVQQATAMSLVALGAG